MRQFLTFLHGRAWTHAEGPVALFEQSVAWLRRHRVLLPGVTVLERLVGGVRERADVRLYAVVAKQVRRADPRLPAALSGLLVVPEGSRVSELEKLRQAPKRTSGTEMVRALQRVDNLAAFGLGRVAVSMVQVRRMKTLAKYGAGSKAPALDRLVQPRRTATLLAVTRALEVEAIDDALDLFALLISEACNVGLTPVIKAGDEALTRGRLSHVDQTSVRAETHAAANAILIEHQGKVPIVAVWGGGLLASVDGLRFVVPVKTINAGPSPKYYGYKRGITWLNAVTLGSSRLEMPGR